MQNPSLPPARRGATPDEIAGRRVPRYVCPMTPGEDMTAEIAEIEALLKRRFGIVRGPFAKRVRKAGNRVPRALRPALHRLVEDQKLMGHPQLARMIDGARVRRDAAQVTEGLEALDLADQRKGFWLGIAGSLAFNLLLFAGLAIWFLHHRGVLG